MNIQNVPSATKQIPKNRPIHVLGRRRRGRQKSRWKDSRKRDTESVGKGGHTGWDKVGEPEEEKKIAVR